MRAAGYAVTEGPDVAIPRGSADSRTTGEGELFVAFSGERADGNEFVDDALARGAAAALCSRPPKLAWPGRTVIVAPDTRTAVAELAIAWRRHCGARVAAITGTVGKTTAKQLTAAVLRQRFPTHESAGNLNSREGAPLAILTMTPADAVSVLELGIDSLGEMDELVAIAEPEVGVVLNIGYTHVSKLGSIENTAREKLTLVRSLPSGGAAILNVDDPRISAASSGLRCRVLSFGQTAGSSLRYGDIRERGLEGTSFALSWGAQTTTVHSPLIGAHTIPAALTAIGVALAFGVPFQEATELVATSNVTGRMRVIQTPEGVTLLDDRYNSSPASLAGALRMLGALPGRRLALLGKMAELGEFEVEEHRKAGQLAAECCDELFTFGAAGKLLACAASTGPARARWFETKDEAAEALAVSLHPGDTVLVKGSRSEALESVLERLEGPA